MRDFILGTAGHVDHGKSELVRALTGISPDRLPEEKSRGLTIDLGFAHLHLPGIGVAGIVDVPGHERFFKNMLSGVGGYEMALLVIDAREGIREQTREHLEILNILEIPLGVVALTKCDLVSGDDIARLRVEAGEFLRGTFLENSPVVAVSSVTGAGIEELKEAIAGQAAKLPPSRTREVFRLPIDRVFVKPGFGTIVTGSLVSGRIRRGDSVWVLPSGKEPLNSRVRGIQVRGREQEEALCGQRVALNISGIPAGELRRGQVVLPRGHGIASRNLDVLLHLSQKREVHPGDRIRFYAGTAEVLGRIARLKDSGREKGIPARLSLEDEVLVFIGDPFILRTGNATATMGGGRILELPRKAARELAPAEEEPGDAGRLVRLAFRREDTGLLSEEQLLKATQLSRAEGKKFLEDALEEKLLLFLPQERRYALWEQVRDLMERILSLLNRLHEASSWKWGWTGGEIRAHFPGIFSGLLNFCLDHLAGEGRLLRLRDRYLAAGFTPRLDPIQEEFRQRLKGLLEERPFQPPSADEIKDRLGHAGSPGLLGEVLEFMTGAGELTEVGTEMYFLSSFIEEAKTKMAELCRSRGSFTPADFRDALESSRKYVIPLLEYFDRNGFTRREGEGRKLGTGTNFSVGPPP
jgi:selenocysteine-specific elongation factor